MEFNFTLFIVQCNSAIRCCSLLFEEAKHMSAYVNKGIVKVIVHPKMKIRLVLSHKFTP